jgi:hypothetical protein
VNQVYGTDSMFAVPLPFSPSATRSAKPKPKRKLSTAASSLGGIEGTTPKRKAPAASGVREATKGSGARKQGKSSRFRGVWLQRQWWYTQSCSKHLGKFEDEADAARAWDDARRATYGKYAHCALKFGGHPRLLNFPSQSEEAFRMLPVEVQRQQEHEEEVVCTKDEEQDTEDKGGGTEDKEEMQVALACVDSEEDTEKNTADKAIEDGTTEDKSETQGEMQQHEHPLREVSIETEVGTIKLDDLLFVRGIEGNDQFYPAKVIGVVPLEWVVVRYFDTADWADTAIFLSIADITLSKVRLRGYYKYSFADVGWFLEEDTELLWLVASFGEGDWPATARLLGTFHTADECSSRYMHLLTDNEPLCAQIYQEIWQADLVSSRNKRQLNLLTKCGDSAKRSKISSEWWK